MNPLEFLELAKVLAANQAESHQRSAVSRAYYGAYNVAKDLIESCGLQFPDTADVHQKLGWCMDASEDQELKVAKVKLNSLRSSRNAADYRMNDPQFAKQITAAVAAAAARKAAFCPKVKAYAKDKLKMTVR